MHKRILSIVLCLAMMMSFAVPAYATDGTASDDIFIADDVIMSDVELTTSYDEDGNVVITTQSEETEAPAEETEAPAEETEAPVEETEALAEETEAPVEETEAPVEETEAPVEETEDAAEKSEDPTEETEAEEILNDDDLTVEDEVVTDGAMDADCEVPLGTRYWNLYNGYYGDNVNHIYGDTNFTNGDTDSGTIYGQFLRSDDTGASDRTLFIDDEGNTVITISPGTAYNSNKDENHPLTGQTKLYINIAGQYRFGTNGGRNSNVTIQLSSAFDNTAITEVIFLARRTDWAMFYITSGSLTLKGTDHTKIVLDGGTGVTNNKYPLIYATHYTKNITLENVVFRNSGNSAIGLLANEIINFTATDCTFESTVTRTNSYSYNSSEFTGTTEAVGASTANSSFGDKSYGGAIYVKDFYGTGLTAVDVVHFKLERCEFDGNQAASYGGAVGLFGRVFDVDVIDCEFKNCKALANSQWGDKGNGGAFYAQGIVGTIDFEGTTFTDCTAKKHGGAVGFMSAPNLNKNYSTINDITFTDCTFTRCKSYDSYGGAISLAAQINFAKFLGCTFDSCISWADGGAISVYQVGIGTGGLGSSVNGGIQYGEVNSYIHEWNGVRRTTIGSFVVDGYTDPETNVIKKTTFVDCVGNQSGGGISFASDSYTEEATINNAVFNRCRSGHNGNAVLTVNTVVKTLDISNSTFENCTSIMGRPLIVNGERIYTTNASWTLFKKETVPAGTTYMQADEKGNFTSKTTSAQTTLYFYIDRLTHDYIKDGNYKKAGYAGNTYLGAYETVEDGGYYKEYYTVDETTGKMTYIDSEFLNNANVGGTIRTTGGSTLVLTINNCIVRRNSSKLNGGGLYFNANTLRAGVTQCTVTINGGEFHDNYAVRDGGGIYCESNMTVSGTKIYNNEARWGGGIAQQVYSNSGRKIVEGEQTNLTLQSDANGNKTLIYNNYARENGGGVSILANPSDSITPDANGNVIPYPVTFVMNDADVYYNAAHDNGGGVAYVALYDKEVIESVYQGTYEECVNEVNSYTKSITLNNANIHGNYAGVPKDWNYSTSTVTGGDGGGIYMSASQNTTLQLNSGKIYSNTAYAGNGGGIYLTGKGAVCKITGGTIGGAASIVHNEDGTTTITGATPNTAYRISPNGGYGGGVAISGGATINMKKGTDANGNETTGLIVCNKSHYQGAGVWLDDGVAADGTGNTITIDHGNVSHNTIDTANTTNRFGGGVYVGTAGSFTISDGNISDNSTPNYGGGVYVNGGTATINGGNIMYNRARTGGGMAAVNGSSLTTTGGSISHNTASLRAGGVFANNLGTTVTLKGGQISYNEAADAGGGVLADNDATVEINKDTEKDTIGKVTHNTAKMGGGIYVAAGAELTIYNGHVTYNEAKGTPTATKTAKDNINYLFGTGGGILIGNGTEGNPSKFTLDASANSDVAIYGNLADFAADDVCANSQHTKLSIPSTLNMNLGDYGLPVMGWFEDYPNEDPQYTQGLKSTPNGVAAYVNGNSDGKFAANENVRYRNVDAAKRREAMYQVTNVDDYAPNKANAYVCLTLGIPAAIDDVVVIDFGLPVDINVIANDAYLQGATLEAIGLKRPATANAFTEELESAPTWTNLVDGGEFNSKYFSAVRKGNTNNITFTPMKMDVKNPMEFAYAVSHNFNDGNDVEKTFYFYANVTVIPATNIYFEDSFVKFTNAKGATSASGVWTQDRTTILKNQETDAPGPNADTEHPELDADNIYGYDDAYANFTTYSLGSAHMVTVDATTGFKDNAPKATFSFTGTGFDVVSLTNNDSGCLWVTVTDSAGNKVKSIIVSNYYGYTYCLCKVTNVYEFDKWVSYVDGKAPDGKAEAKPQYPSNPKHNTKVISYEYRWVADANASDTLYQVPVIKVDDLPYGTYDVEMKVVYLISQDIPANGQPGGSYTVWIDAIRVYNPRQGDATSENVYVQDGENNPHYTTVKKLLLDPNTYMANGSGIGYVDGKSSNVTLDEYANQGPNNEIYLRKDNGLAFKLRSYSSTKPEVNLQIGVKLAKGSTATLAWTYVSESGVYINGTDINVTTSTNMFYKLCNVQWSNTYSTLGYWESKPIYLKCSSTGNLYDGILSLTDLKLTGAGAAEIALPSSEESTVAVDGKLMAIYDGEVAQFVEDILKSEQSESQKTINLAYPTLSFEDEIKYNFYYTVENLDVAVEDMGLITWSAKPEDATFAAAETVIPGAIYNAATGEYMVRTNGIPAKKLGDDVYFKVYAKLSDGTYAYSSLARYSAKYYAEDRLENSNSAAMKAACVAMLNYGAAAQMHFGYKTDALVNADLNAEQKALVSEYSADMINALPTVDAAKAGDFVANGGFTTGYPTVSFEGAFAINYYFVPNKTIDGDLTLYCWDLETYNSVDKLTADNATAKVVMTQTATGEYFGTYSGIAAKQIDETVFVACVYESDGVRYSTSVVPYSVGAYCVDKAANGSDTMKVFAAETAVFGHYAKIYFDNLQK